MDWIGLLLFGYYIFYERTNYIVLLFAFLFLLGDRIADVLDKNKGAK